MSLRPANIPCIVGASSWRSTGSPQLPDGATNVVRTMFSIDDTHYRGGSIDVIFWLYATAAGLVDLDYSITYFEDTNESAVVAVATNVNCDLTWAVAARTKRQTITVPMTAIKARRMFQVDLRGTRATDANTGDVVVVGVEVKAARALPVSVSQEVPNNGTTTH